VNAIGTTVDPMAEVASLYDTLKNATTHELKRRNLATLWKVLEEMRRTNARDFSLAEVGRRLEKLGGPKTQSLRNEGGKDFRSLIEAFASVSGGSSQRNSCNDQSQLDIALDALQNPNARALFKQVVAENRLLKWQNDELRSAFKLLSVSARSGPPQAPVKQVLEAEILPPPASADLLLPSEIEALRRSVDTDRLAENGWTVQPNGSIVDDMGTSVLPPGFAIAVTKIVNR
jgi:nitrate/nitrite-specific signal transduction histidine kinase